MKSMVHTSAEPSHYDCLADNYDAFNEKNSAQINQLIAKLLQHYGVQTVLDLSCGTGSQALWLTQCGYEVVGVDMNRKMLNIAKAKTQEQHLDIRFIEGDMRDIRVGEFDAVITIFNAIGHLTQQDFRRSLSNIRHQLHDRGLYIFDIFNLAYLLQDDHITRLTIDWQTLSGSRTTRDIQYSTVNAEGILASYDLCFECIGDLEPTTSTYAQTLQIYTAQQIKALLYQHGFKVLQQCQIDGGPLSKETERIVTIAIKASDESSDASTLI